MKKENTATRLKQIMKKRQLRQVDILEKCKPFCQKFDVKFGRNDLSQYVNGKVEPRQDKLTVLGLALNVSEAWLMGYDVPIERNCGKIVKIEEPPEIMQYYTQLNDIGKKTATEQVRLLTLDEKYTRLADVFYIKEPEPEYDIVAAHGDAKTTDEQLEKMDGDTILMKQMRTEKEKREK